MKDKIYLVMSKTGVAKMTKNPPAIKPNQRSFTIIVSITDKIFESPQFMGKMEIKEIDLDIVDKLEFELKLLKKKG